MLFCIFSVFVLHLLLACFLCHMINDVIAFSYFVDNDSLWKASHSCVFGITCKWYCF